MSRSTRTLADVGESALIERIGSRAGLSPGRNWPLAIGDDAAILRPRAGWDVVLSVDAVVEDVHFRFSREAPRTIGRRALIVNLSDLAAMGAEPLGCLLSLMAPRSLAVAVFDGLVEGVIAESTRHGCPLVGGNLSAATRTSLTITVVGRVERGGALRRGCVAAGDRLFVTGRLGVGALSRLRADRASARLRRLPTPRLAAGRALARLPTATGCVDLSDGLTTDLAHLLGGTGLGAEVDPAALPRPEGFEAACARLGVDPLELLCAGGEDYELLFAVRPPSGAARGRPPSLSGPALSIRLGVPVREIGRVVSRPGLHGLPVRARPHHF